LQTLGVSDFVPPTTENFSALEDKNLSWFPEFVDFEEPDMATDVSGIAEPRSPRESSDLEENEMSQKRKAETQGDVDGSRKRSRQTSPRSCLWEGCSEIFDEPLALRQVPLTAIYVCTWAYI
jgi:hypothetical protein